MMSALAAEKRKQHRASTCSAARKCDFKTLLSPARAVRLLFDASYILVELVVVWRFKPVSALL